MSVIMHKPTMPVMSMLPHHEMSMASNKAVQYAAPERKTDFGKKEDQTEDKKKSKKVTMFVLANSSNLLIHTELEQAEKENQLERFDQAEPEEYVQGQEEMSKIVLSDNTYFTFILHNSIMFH